MIHQVFSIDIYIYIYFFCFNDYKFEMQDIVLPIDAP